MKDAFCKILLLSMAFGVGTLTAQTTPPNCPNVHDTNGNYTIDIQDFLSLLGLFQDVDVDYDGVWDSADDCTDAEACNYTANPTESCAYTDVLGICGGGCEDDSDGDGICDVSGCTDPNAGNYDPSATNEDGSCLACQEFQGFSVTLNDVYTDGWTFVGLTNYITLQGGGLDTTITLADGLSTNTFYFCADLSECIQLTYVPEDEWFGENSWVVEVAGEQVLAGSGTPTASVTAFGNGCVLGCLDPVACNYNPEANLQPLAACDFGNPEDYDECGICNGPGAIYECGCFPCPENCGVVSYQGYDYATVIIGEQCWFAENLRSENYSNGETIPSALSNDEWSSTTSGANAVRGENAFDLETYGRLYNWYAVGDTRGLCPSGWHVPTDGEWAVMTDHLGGEAIAGDHMKTTYGWNDGGNGTNSSGFSGLPGGGRPEDGSFINAGYNGIWWSSSPFGSNAWGRLLFDNDELVFRQVFPLRDGFSVRCIQDTE